MMELRRAISILEEMTLLTYCEPEVAAIKTVLPILKDHLNEQMQRELKHLDIKESRPTEPLRCPLCGREPELAYCVSNSLMDRVIIYRLQCCNIIGESSTDSVQAVENWNAIVGGMLRGRD